MTSKLLVAFFAACLASACGATATSEGTVPHDEPRGEPRGAAPEGVECGDLRCRSGEICEPCGTDPRCPECDVCFPVCVPAP